MNGFLQCEKNKKIRFCSCAFSCLIYFLLSECAISMFGIHMICFSE